MLSEQGQEGLGGWAEEERVLVRVRMAGAGSRRGRSQQNNSSGGPGDWQDTWGLSQWM